MTDLEFRVLPLLLRLEQVRQVTGLSVEALRGLEEAGRLRTVRTAGGHRRWRKVDVVNLVKAEEIC